MHKVCLHCGAHLSENAKFCDRCGTALPPQVTVSATASAQCNKCGAAIKSNARFCSVCGNIIDLNLFADKPTTQDYSNTEDIDSAEGPEYGAGRSASATESSKKQNCDEHTSARKTNEAQTARNETSTAPDTPIRPHGKKKYVFAATSILLSILICFCLLAGGEENKIRNAYMTQYDTELSVGETFENRFKDCKWSSKRADGNTFVSFTGYDTETLIDWKVIFKIKGDEFIVSEIQLDEQVITDSQDLHYLMSYIYTGDWNTLWGDAFLYSLFS